MAMVMALAMAVPKSVGSRIFGHSVRGPAIKRLPGPMAYQCRGLG